MKGEGSVPAGAAVPPPSTVPSHAESGLARRNVWVSSDFQTDEVN